MNLWFALAAVMSASTCLTHVFVGGRFVARPLLAAAELRSVPRMTSYFCWHLVTLALVAQTAAFAMAAGGGSRELAFAATLFAALAAALCLAMIARFELRPLRFPQWALFVPIAAFGAAGLAGW